MATMTGDDPMASQANAEGSLAPGRGLDPETIERWKAGVAAERGRRAPPASFPRLPDIPGGRYTDPAFYELEREALLKRGWVYAGHADQLPEVADAGQATRSFTCGYHGWTYLLDGTLASVPDARDFAGLDLSCRSLVPVRCGQLGNFIFVCEDAKAEPLATFLEPVARFFRHLPLDELRLVHRRAIELDGNYKVVLENFLEAYHFRLLHQQTTHRIFDAAGTSVHLWRNGHSMMLTPNRRANWVDPGTIGMPEMATATTIERDHNPSYSVAIWPIGLGRTMMEVLWFAPDWGGGDRDPLWETRIANFDRIVDEDVSFVAPIQASISSPGFKGVPLSYQERRIYHWHEELDRRIGVERIPVHLRIEPMLGALIED